MINNRFDILIAGKAGRAGRITNVVVFETSQEWYGAAQKNGEVAGPSGGGNGKPHCLAEVHVSC